MAKPIRVKRKDIPRFCSAEEEAIYWESHELLPSFTTRLKQDARLQVRLIWTIGSFLFLLTVLLLFISQLGGKDIYGTYYNDPLEAEWESNKVNHPCIVLQLNQDGSFEQVAYYAKREVLTLKGNYTVTKNSLKFSDFISYTSEIDIKRRKLSSKRFIHEQGYFLTYSHHWYNSYSIPSGNDEDNYYVKPRDGRCKSLP